MAFNIEFQMQVKFNSRSEFKTWREQVLIEQRTRLESLQGFSEKFDESDEDLLTDLIIEDTATLEEALDELRRVGHEITAEDIAEWRPAVDDEGSPGIYLLENRKLRRDSPVDALFDHLHDNPAPAQLRINRISLNDHANVTASGSFRDFDAYCYYRLPLIFAGTSAQEFGGRGHVSFFGVERGVLVALFCDFQENGIRINEPDVQDAVAWRVHDRFDSIELTSEGLRHRL
ncbi:hypothetical protein OG985_46950 [Streptomyces sp. NBC_00289]|uniref:hypothetical protein n=1 Tax=Streptomyces sp. NBC_00289 TaxID=2975703 RepID=UPI003255C020